MFHILTFLDTLRNKFVILCENICFPHFLIFIFHILETTYWLHPSLLLSLLLHTLDYFSQTVLHLIVILKFQWRNISYCSVFNRLSRYLILKTFYYEQTSQEFWLYWKFRIKSVPTSCKLLIYTFFDEIKRRIGCN